jgi:hypothetical protein
LCCLRTADPAPTAAALAERIATQGAADAAWELVRLGRDNEVTAMALVALAPWLSRERLLDAERRVLSASIGPVMLPTELGRHSADRNDLTAFLAPSLARAGQVQRALECATQAGDKWRIAACLGIAEATDGRTRSSTLLVALRALLAQRDVFRKDGIDDVARAIARDRDAAQPAWAEAIAWARSRPRNEAIEVLTALAPVAAAARGEALVDEVFAAIERVVRWWP